MSLGKLLMIGFWVVVIPLVLYTLASDMIQGGQERIDARPTYENVEPVHQIKEVIQTETGARMEVSSYTLRQGENGDMFEVEVVVKNVGGKRVSGSMTIYPYRYGYGSSRDGTEMNITPRDSYWNVSETRPIITLDPGESDTVTIKWQRAQDRYPVDGFNDVNVKLSIDEQ